MKKLILFILPVFVLSSCLGGSDDTSKQAVTHDVSYYKNVWKDLFRYYQAATTNIPKKGKFDFQFTSMVTGSGDSLTHIGGMGLREKFSTLSVELLGEHDFENVDAPSLNATLKVYLNKRAFGAGDIDITFRIDGSGSVDYSLNHIDGKTLAFLGLPKETVEELVLAFDEHKWAMQHSDTRAEFLREIIATVTAKQKDVPLVENTASEEKQIIDAFLETETIEVMAGSEVGDGVSRLTFRFNPENFVTFLNRVGKILGGDNANKTFESDQEFLKAFTIAGTMDVSGKKLVDSKILSELPISGTDKTTGTKRYDLFASENQFLFPNPERFDVSWTSLFYAKGTPGNKIQFQVKWLIK